MKTIDYIIEQASPADIDQLVALEQDLFMTDKRSRKNLLYLIKRSAVFAAKTRQGGTVIGYAILLSRKNSRRSRIYALGVASTVRNRGIGSRLVATLERVAGRKDCTSLILEVGDRNRAAVEFYNRCGFKQFGFRYGYYEDGGHAILMDKKLSAGGTRK